MNPLCDVYYDVTPPNTCFRPGPVWGCDRLVSRAKVIENQIVYLGYGSSGPGCTGGGGDCSCLTCRLLELDTHSSSEVDPSESSPPSVSVAPMVLPFLCSDDSESDTEMPERHLSLTTSTPEIPTAPILPAPSAVVAPSFEFPLAPVVAPPRIRQAILIRPGEDIPIGRLYRTHLGGPYHSSSGHSTSGHSLLGHASLDTTVADSSTPLRFVHLPLARTPQYSEAYLCWRDSILLEDSVEEDIDADVLEDIKADATAVEVVVDRDVMTGIDACIDMEVDVGFDVEDEVEDEVESSDRGTMEVRVDVVAGIDIPDAMARCCREFGAD
ncbi:hypothetical protein Tco_0479405 [Tanacetum coccineum]